MAWLRARRATKLAVIGWTSPEVDLQAFCILKRRFLFSVASVHGASVFSCRSVHVPGIIMKLSKNLSQTLSKDLSIALLAVAAALAFSAHAADDGGLPKVKPEPTTAKSRAEVKAERATAAKAGQLNQSSHANPMGDKASLGEKKTRAEVKTETAAARKADGGSLKTPKD
jgi:hypothetical protein